MHKDNKLKGDIGEQHVVLKLLEAGLNVLRPVGDRLPYDLVVEKNGVFKRVQCKYRALHGKNHISVSLSNRFGSSSVVYSEENIDTIAIYCPDTDDVCFLNMSELIGFRELYILVMPPAPGYHSKKYIKCFSNPNRIFTGEAEEVNSYTKKEYQPNESIRKVKRPSKELLQKIIWEKPITHIAQEYGISDNGVRKWCKTYGIIDLPPRGYWQKLQAGKL